MKKTAITIIFACFCFFSITGTAFCDFDAFMRITGAPGEIIITNHSPSPEWIKINGFSWRLERSGPSDPSGRGVSASAPDVGPLTIIKALDKSSPKIIKYALKGNYIEEVIIELCNSEGNKEKFYEIKMHNVIISHVFPHAESDSISALLSESVDFEFEKVEVTYTPYSHNSGERMTDVSVEYNRYTNTVN